jgi:uncharacterized protein YyaL (SSP411 family)
MSANRLATATSPYLLQHRENPVHWWPWGEDALAEARRTGKPILLSIGYAACHWCHVMAHESFEDDATAALMNELFVNIKVDREERPDIDAIYMGALHRLGQQGGWPLTMFLDAAARPFWGGTYFPPVARWGKPAFSTVLREIARIHRDERDKVDANAHAILESLTERDPRRGKPVLTDEVLANLTARLTASVDRTHGGLRGAPKFPQWSVFWFLWRGAIRYGDADAKAAVLTTLRNICQGGIYDHLGGGFARYAVDERWLVPHFEKMLYDNALLLDLLTEAWRETGDRLFAARCRETVEWLFREMIAGDAFAASLDADSEGEEGKFYVWTLTEILDVLGHDHGHRFAAAYDVTADGNWEGHTILNRLHALDWNDDLDRTMAPLRGALLKRRATRVRPGFDDKVLTDWNGLLIAALARAGVVFGEPSWIDRAARAYDFVVKTMTEDGRLLHTWRQGGRAHVAATATDYANMIWAATRLAEVRADPRYLDHARTWTEILDRHYWDEAGGYALTADDTRDVIVRLRPGHDDAMPNANAIMISNLSRLHTMTGDTRFRDRAHEITDAFAVDLGKSVFGHTGMLAAFHDLIAQSHVVLVANDQNAPDLAAEIHRVAIPGAIEQRLPPGVIFPPGSPLHGKQAIGGGATVYVCSGLTCSMPITDPAHVADAIRSATRLALSKPATSG